MPKPKSTRKTIGFGAGKITAPVQGEKRTALLELEMLQALQKIGAYTSELTMTQDGSVILPASLWAKLAVAVVLSRVGLAAQNAQRLYGVPASFLIAQFIVHHGYDGEPEATEGERFMGESQLLSEAKELATNPQFLPALELRDSPVAYARRLCELGLGDDSYLLDLAGLIVDHDLWECDLRYGTPPEFLGKNVSVDEAAAILSESPTSIRYLIKSGELIGLLYPGADHRDHVVGHSIYAYTQRRLLQEIEEHGKAMPARGKLLLMDCQPSPLDHSSGPTAG